MFLTNNMFGQNYLLTFKSENDVLDSVKIDNLTLHSTLGIQGRIVVNILDTCLSGNNVDKDGSKALDKRYLKVSDNRTVEYFYYKKNNLLKITGFSGINKTVVMIVPKSDTTITFYFERCVDVDGNSYAVMKIGSQLWMVENLKTTHYRNGDSIINGSKKELWDTLPSGAYRNYFDMPKYIMYYGRLYNWFAVNDPRGLAPEGWRIPDVDDWSKMENTAIDGGNDKVIGNQLKEMALVPAGYCDPKGSFDGIGKEGFWWLAYDADSQKAWYVYLKYSTSSVGLTSCNKHHGFSVRCVKSIK